MISASQPSPAPAKQAFEIIREIHKSVFEAIRIKEETKPIHTLQNAILQKFLINAFLRPAHVTTRTRMAHAARLELTAANMPTIEKLESFITYFPHHLVSASLITEIAFPRYIAFKDNLVILENNPEFDALTTHLNAEEKALLMQFMNQTRDWLLNESKNLFEVEETLQQLCKAGKVTTASMQEYHRDIATHFFMRSIAHPLFQDNNALVAREILEEHNLITKILKNPQKNWLDPASLISHEEEKKDDDDKTITKLAGVLNRISSNTLKLLDVAIKSKENTEKLTAVKGLLDLGRSMIQKPSDSIELVSNSIELVEELKQQAIKNESRNRTPAKRTLADIYKNGNKAELQKALGRQFDSKDLFKAARAGNRKLANELQLIKSINVNDRYVERDENRVSNAKDSDETGRSSLEIAAENSHLDVVKLLLKHPRLELTESVIALLLVSEKIDEKIKTQIREYRARKAKQKTFSWEPKQPVRIEPVTPAESPSPTVTEILSSPSPSPRAVLSPTSKTEINDATDPLTLANQYFELIETGKVYDLAGSLNLITEYITILENEYASDAEAVEFTKQLDSNYKEMNKRYQTLATEAGDVENDFKSHKIPALKKTHMQIGKKIRNIKTELDELKKACADKLKYFETKPVEITPIAPKPVEIVVAKPANVRSTSAPSITSVNTTLFAISATKKKNYHDYKLEFIDKLRSFINFDINPLDEVGRNLQLHAILFEVSQFMFTRSQLHPKVSKDPSGDFSKYVHDGIVNNRILMGLTFVPAMLDSLHNQVMEFAKSLISTLESHSFNSISINEFCIVLTQNAKDRENFMETYDIEELNYIARTNNQSIAFQEYSDELPVGMKKSALSLANVKAKLYDGHYDFKLDLGEDVEPARIRMYPY